MQYIFPPDPDTYEDHEDYTLDSISGESDHDEVGDVLLHDLITPCTDDSGYLSDHHAPTSKYDNSANVIHCNLSSRGTANGSGPIMSSTNAVGEDERENAPLAHASKDLVEYRVLIKENLALITDEDNLTVKITTTPRSHESLWLNRSTQPTARECLRVVDEHILSSACEASEVTPREASNPREIRDPGHLGSTLLQRFLNKTEDQKEPDTRPSAESAESSSSGSQQSEDTDNDPEASEGAQGQLSPQSLDLADFEAYTRVELPRLVEANLQSLVNAEFAPLEDHLRAMLVDIVRRCQSTVAQNYNRIHLIVPTTGPRTDSEPLAASVSQATGDDIWRTSHNSRDTLDERALFDNDTLRLFEEPPMLDSNTVGYVGMLEPYAEINSNFAFSDSGYLSISGPDSQVPLCLCLDEDDNSPGRFYVYRQVM
ncbi:MAG: hypothetical protein Q9220_007305 [cf. Caloplaca sp. 1 TL-2023]